MDQQLEKAAEDAGAIEDLEGSTEIEEEAAGKGSKDSDVRNSLNEDGTLPANALDLRFALHCFRKGFQKLKLELIFSGKVERGHLTEGDSYHSSHCLTFR